MVPGPDTPEAALASLGFTDTEAAIYCELLRASPSTGYRLAQAIGKAPANTYQALAALTQKGAVLVDEGETRAYRAVPSTELLAAMERGFAARRAEAEAALSTIAATADDDRLYQLKSVPQVFEKARALIAGAREILLFDLFPEPLSALKQDLERAQARGVTLAGLTYGPPPLLPPSIVVSRGSDVVFERWPGRQVSLVADARQHMEVLLTHDGTGVRHGVWSDSAYLACLRHSGLAAEIRMSANPGEAELPLAKLSLLRSYPAGLRDLIGPPMAGDRTGDAA